MEFYGLSMINSFFVNEIILFSPKIMELYLFYHVLTEKGYLNEELFWEYGCREEMMISIRPELGIPRVDAAKDSLGHGMTLVIVFILSFLMQGEPFLIFILVGNEDINERSRWKGLSLEIQNKHDTRTLIMDHNKLKLSCRTEDIHPLVPLWGKFCTFNWKELVEEVNGQNLKMIWDVFSQAKIRCGYILLQVIFESL